MVGVHYPYGVWSICLPLMMSMLGAALHDLQVVGLLLQECLPAAADWLLLHTVLLSTARAPHVHMHVRANPH